MTRFCLLPLLGSLLWSGQLEAAANQIGVTRSGADLVFTWDGRGVLQQAGALDGVWQDVPDATTSPHKLRPAAKSSFFRIRYLYPVKVIKAGHGTGEVASDPPGIQCGADCEHEYAAGTQVTLTATPAAGSVFSGWSGDATGTGPCTLTVNAAKTITATFDLLPPPSGLVNGDFEEGPAVGWTQEPYPLIQLASALGVQAASGLYVARLGPTETSDNAAVIGQVVTLPAVWPLYLHFAVWIYSQEMCEVGLWDTMGLYINGQAAIENGRLCHSDSTGGWVRNAFDLSSYAGQTIQLEFALWSPYFDPLGSIVLLDELYLDQFGW